MTDIEKLRAELQSHKEWLKSRDEQIWRYYVKALDDGREILRLKAALEAAATLQPGEGDGWVKVDTAVVRFLNGEAQLDGKWFGDATLSENGRIVRYWWRKYLRNALFASPVIPSAGGEVVVSPKLLEHLQICADSGANLSRDEVQELLDILSPARAAIAVIQEQKP